MLRRLTTTIIALLTAISLLGQNPGHKLEIGGGYAPFFVSSVDDGIYCRYRTDAYVEYRYDFGTHIDVGAKLDYKNSPAACYDMGAANWEGFLHFIGLFAVSDINFNPGGKIRPFIGLGIGPALFAKHWTSVTVYNPEHIPDSYPKAPYTDYIFTPALTVRAGIEVFKHLRLALNADAFLNSSSEWPACISVGWVF